MEKTQVRSASSELQESGVFLKSKGARQLLARRWKPRWPSSLRSTAARPTKKVGGW